MPNALTDFRNDHHVIMGLFLIAVGAFGAIGSITGRLPAMIAGLFDPADLVSSNAPGASGSSGILQNSGITGTNISAATGTGPASDIIGSGLAGSLESTLKGLLP